METKFDARETILLLTYFPFRRRHEAFKVFTKHCKGKFYICLNQDLKENAIDETASLETYRDV